MHSSNIIVIQPIKFSQVHFILPSNLKWINFFQLDPQPIQTLQEAILVKPGENEHIIIS